MRCLWALESAKGRNELLKFVRNHYAAVLIFKPQFKVEFVSSNSSPDLTQAARIESKEMQPVPRLAHNSVRQPPVVHEQLGHASACPAA